MKIRIKISIFGVLMLLILLFGDNSEYALIALCAAATHEIGHIIVSRALNIKFESFKIGLTGARLGTSLPMYSYTKELILASSGPAANVICGGISALLYKNTAIDPSNDYILFFSVASFFLAILNMLPIRGFDGGRIFLCLCALGGGIYKAEKILKLLSFSFILLLWILSIYFMLRIGSSLALFVFSSALFAELFINSDTFKK